MKRTLLCVSIIFLAICSVFAVQQRMVQFQPLPAQRAFAFQLNGKWIPDIPDVHVGPKNFITLQNLWPIDTGYETVSGYSKINTATIDTPVNLHHFVKSGETHVIAKVNNSGTYKLYENTTAISSAGDFSGTALYSGLAANAGSFANGPEGTMFYADGIYNLVTGGDELYPEAFYVGDDTDSLLDHTSKINNALTSQIAYVGSQGNDSYSVLLLHMDGNDGSTTFTDDGATGHSPSANGDAQIDTALYKFNNASGLFDGTGDYVSVADHANWFLGTGDFTIDAWVRFTDLGDNNNTHPIYSQFIDTNNYILFSVYSNVVNSQQLQFSVASAGAATISVSSTPTVGLLQNDTWYHVAIVRNGNDFDAYLNGVSIASSTDSDSVVDLAAPLRIGEHNGSYFKGSIDELRVSKGIARWSSDFTPSVSPYSASYSYFYICSPYKLDGAKLYIQEANQETSTLSAAVWTGASFSSLTITDNTASGGISLAQNGTVTWEYSEDPRPLYINGQTLYVYRFAVDAGGAGIYKATVSAPLQPIRDIWNESPRTCIAFQVFNDPTYQADTFLVQAKDSTADTPYASNIGGLGADADDAIFVYFDDRAMGIKLDMLSNKVNAAANTISDIQYWDGSAYASVGYFSDGTLNSGGTASFNQSGTVSWTPPEEGQEFVQEEFGVRGYGYKIVFSNTTAFTADTQIDLVTGITAPLEINGYDYVGTYNRRVMLIKENKVDFSQTGKPWVFNGVDSSDLGIFDDSRQKSFGENSSIVATFKIYNRYGSNLIEGFGVLQNNATHILVGSQPYLQFSEPIITKTVSENIGCAAPLTVNSYEMETASGLRANVVFWLDFSGPIRFDGTTPTKIQGVDNYFDPTASGSINYSAISTSIAYIDTIRSEWNLLIPTGAATSPNTWLVYNMEYDKWYEKVPPTYLVASAGVTDSSGVRYNYGITSGGQMYYLDNGNTWDSTAISQVIQTGLFSPPFKEGDKFGLWTESEIRSLRLASEVFTGNVDITATIYADGSSADTATIPLDQASVAVSQNSVGNSGNVTAQGNYYSVKFATSTSGSEKWRPLAYGIKAREKRED